MMTFTMLGQAATAGISFWQVMERVGLFAAIAASLAAIAMARRKRETRRIEPQPLSIEMVSGYVRKEECVSRHNESMNAIDNIQRDLSELRAQRITDAKDAGASREKMYAAIDKVRLELAASMGEIRRDVEQGFKDTERAIGRIEGKIDQKL